MRGPRIIRLLMATSIALAGVAITANAAAQQYEQPAPAESPADAGFGNRDSFVLSVERFLGFQSQEFGDEDTPTYDSTGMQPVFWGNVGLFGVMSSGLSFGSTFGVSYFESTLFGEGDNSVYLFRVGPRIGYAGTTQTKQFGYWVRGGPSFFVVHSEQEDSSGGSDSEWTTILAASVELYGVILPVPHFGILVGPHADIHLVGDDDAEYRSYGLTFGVMGEFY